MTISPISCAFNALALLPAVVDIYEYLDGAFLSRILYRLIAADNRHPLEQLLNINNAGSEAQQKLHEALLAITQENYEKALVILNEIREPYRSMRHIEAAKMIAFGGAKGDNIYRKSLRRFLEKYGDEPGVELVLMEQAEMLGQPDEFLRWVDSLDALVHDPYLNIYRANARLMRGEDSLAISLAKEVVAVDSTWILPHRVLLLAGLVVENHEQVLVEMRRLAELDDHWPYLREYLESPPPSPFLQTPEYKEAKPYLDEIAKNEE